MGKQWIRWVVRPDVRMMFFGREIEIPTVDTVGGMGSVGGRGTVGGVAELPTVEAPAY